MNQTSGFLTRTAIISDREEFCNRFEKLLKNDFFLCERVKSDEPRLSHDSSPYDLILVDNAGEKLSLRDTTEYFYESFSPRYIISVVQDKTTPHFDGHKHIKIPDHITDYALNSIFLALANIILREKQQSEYSSLLLHDVRSPLNSLVGYLELLNNGTFGELSRGQKNILEKAIQMADDTLDIVEELSDVFKYEQSSFQIDPHLFNLNNLLDNVLSTVWIRADQKNIHIRKSIDGTVRQIRGDEYYLQRLLINLITNAIQHSPADSTISIEATLTSLNELKLSVHDMGSGVSDNELPKLFDKYFRMDGKNSKKRGQGLGLYICKLIAEAHAGKITAERNSDGGLTFTLTLPAGNKADLHPQS